MKLIIENFRIIDSKSLALICEDVLSHEDADEEFKI